MPIRLKQHQKDGVRFLVRVRNGILGDEMGTGKTLTALSGAKLLLKHKRIQQALFIVPATLIDTWVREARKLGITMLVYHGSSRKNKRKLLGRAQYILTTYHTFTSDVESFDKMSERCLQVLDEGHIIKESFGKIAQTVKMLSARYRWLMTGTPVGNQPHDLYSLVHFVDPVLAGDRAEWWNQYVKEKTFMVYTRDGRQLMRRKPVGVKDHAIPALNDLLRRVMLRRLKRECLDLPQKQVIYHDYKLTNRMRSLMRRTIGEHEEAGTQLSKILIRVQQILDGIYKQENEEGEVISVEYINPMPPKAAILREMLLDRSGRVIVWFRFRESLEYLKKAWPDLPIYTYTGANATKRLGQIEKWREDSNGILFATIRAAGVGLTLTEADTAIFYSAEFSPSLNQQAEDRIHRLGQERPTTVYYLYGVRTIEEALVHLLRKKAKLNRAVVDADFSQRDLRKLYEYQLSLFDSADHCSMFMEGITNGKR